ncbi:MULTISPECIES: hypothetical protein [Gordonia]|uniref:hypothetical protein n=1 Tax=Gordonia TaxID=2053 RepID=UPI0010F9F0DC|nr:MULTISPECIES: hypothetical protein [unclassified Gordonia (in: high G+C Gram-positive bacteria)]
MTDTKQQRKDTMLKATGLARVIAEGDQDPETLLQVSDSLDTARQLAVGELSADGIDRQIAEHMVARFAEVDPENGPAWLWNLQQLVAKTVVSYYGDAKAQALVDELRWADAIGPPEPWETDQASPPQDAEIPAPSSMETAEQVDPGPEAPLADVDPSDPLWDNSDSGGSTAEDPDADPVEVIDAEVVEVERVTSSQTTHKLPPGQFYSPSNRPSWERSLKRSRPSIEISTSSAHLDDRR